MQTVEESSTPATADQCAQPLKTTPSPQRLLRSLLLLRRRLLRRSLLSSDSLSLLLLSLPLLLLLLPLELLLPLSLLLLPLPLSLLLLPPRAALRAASSAALRSAMMRGICSNTQSQQTPGQRQSTLAHARVEGWVPLPVADFLHVIA